MDEEAYEQRALAFLGLGQLDKALVDAEEALRLATERNNRNKDSVLVRGAIHAARGDADLSRLKMDTNVRPFAYYWRARALASNGRYRAAWRDLTKAIDGDETQGKYFYHRALCYEALGKDQAAEEDLKRAFLLDPNAKTRN